MEKYIDNLICDIKNIFSDRFVSAVLFGSYASGNYHKGISDINIIIILDQLQAHDLKIAYPAIKKWKKSNNPAPIFMDKEEWQNSCDVYAIEYSDIKQKHKLLYGEDLITRLIIDKCNLRLQCESEIKKLLIKLRQTYLANSDSIKIMDNAIKKSVSVFLTIFRGILRLSDENIPVCNIDVISEFACKSGISKEIFIEILEYRQNNKMIPKDKTEYIIQNLIDSLHQILVYADKIKI